jgi:RNA polymerase sigma-70 factor, ECF subfamily
MEQGRRHVDVPDQQRDELLIRRAREGDTQAFGQLYQRHVDRVFSFVVFRLRDTDVAEDLTQEVFIQAFRALHTFDWRGALAPWLLRIARNTVIDYWRRVARRPEHALSLADSGDDEEDEDRLGRLGADAGEIGVSWVESMLDRERIGRAAAQLTELQQQVLALRFASGLTIRETAEVMVRTEGAIKNLQHHALRTLKRHLEADEVDD